MSIVPEFTLDGYSQILLQAQKSGYEFIDFSQMKSAFNKPVCLLRHDIDVDMVAAYEMAKIEHDLGIRSTYFLMMRSPVYNLFSRFNHTLAQKILSLGHSIGLHYDQSFYAGDHYSEVQWIDWESKVLEEVFNTKIVAVSFHQPNNMVLSGMVGTGKRFNTYTDPKNQGFTYISDSNRKWRHEHPFNCFENCNPEKIQLLIHPLWWVYGQQKTTEAVWERAISSNLDNMQRQLLETEQAYGSERIFSIAKKASDQ